jgi:RNA polymerase sporulation-specific sigma factor
MLVLGDFMLFSGLLSIFKDLLIFSAYVDTKSSFPKPLSKEKETEYLRLSKEGDETARELLIKHNLRLVAHIAKKYINYPDTDELISVGSIGLIKAINTFEEGKGTQLATYAARCIENEILMLLRSGKKHKCNVSLEEPVGIDKDGNEISLIDILTSASDSVFDGVESNILMERLLELTKRTLDAREYDIIILRYGLGGKAALTQREVAEKYEISRSYISRIEKRAVEKLRAAIKKEDLYFD